MKCQHCLVLANSTASSSSPKTEIGTSGPSPYLPRTICDVDMRIGILVDDALSPDSGGVGQSIRGLVESLVKYDGQNEYVLIHASRHDVRPWNGALEAAPNVTWVRIPIKRRLLQRLIWPVLRTLGPERWTGPLDILHIMSNITSVPTGSNTVVTIHDMFPELYPGQFKWTGRIYRRGLLTQVRKRSAAVITPSHATASDVSNVLGIPAERITVTHWGLPIRADNEAIDDEALVNTYDLPERYVIFTGRIHPRKNVENLIHAFSMLRRRRDYPHHLLLAGSLGWGANKILSTVDSLDLGKYVHHLGFVPDNHILPLLRKADIYVYPSLCEGFGFPLLEAMSCRTPIAASNAHSIPEVAGDAAVYFDPQDPLDMSNAMASILDNSTLAENLKDSGQDRLRIFDWEKTAKLTLEVYKRVGSGKGG